MKRAHILGLSQTEAALPKLHQAHTAFCTVVYININKIDICGDAISYVSFRKILLLSEISDKIGF